MRKRSLVVGILLVGGIVAVGLWLAPSILGSPVPPGAGESSPPSASPSGSPSASPGGSPSGSPSGSPGDVPVPGRPDDAFALTVDYVYDGDTIRATVVTPNEVVTTSNPIRIRLIGIDTPEGTPTVECGAEEARDHLVALLPEGSRVWAAVDRDSWDDYKRRLFNLWTDDGVFVNHELVAAGDAEAIRVWPNVAFYDLLLGAQQDAEADGRGMWGAC